MAHRIIRQHRVLKLRVLAAALTGTLVGAISWGIPFVWQSVFFRQAVQPIPHPATMLCKAALATGVWGDCSGVDLSGANLAHRTIRVQLVDANLRGANLTGAVLEGIRIDGADLTGARLENALMLEVVANGTTFHDTQMKGVRMVGGAYRGNDFSLADLKSAVLSDGVSVFQGDFAGAELDAIRLLGGTRIVDARFERVSMQDALIEHSLLQGVSFVKAKLHRVRIDHGSVTEGEFIESVLDDAAITHADMQGTDFSGTSFKGARISETTLERTSNFPSSHPALFWGPTLENVVMSNGETRNPPTVSAKHEH